MITVLFVLGIFAIILGILLLIWRINEGMSLVVCGIIFIAPFLVYKFHSEPTKQDVLDGKAIYQETQIITGNDTIKTYDIVWKTSEFYNK